MRKPLYHEAVAQPEELLSFDAYRPENVILPFSYSLKPST